MRYSGIYPVLYAFFRADGGLDEDAMRAQVEHCLAAGAHGITVLGLVTEVNKLDTAERRHLVDVVGAAIAKRVPYAVTIAEPDVEGQIAFARHAKQAGADWAILQPPPGAGIPERELQRHFGAIADRIELPVAIQNNPVNLASSLSPDALVELVKAHANIRLLKAEGWSVEIARVIEACDGAVDAFGGHGGLEFVSLIRSGGAGLIPAPDCVALQVAVFEGLRGGDPARIAEAERLHETALPLVVFMTRSLPGLVAYGKRLMARRLGLPEPLDRAPFHTPTEFGRQEADRLFAAIETAERKLARRKP
ncbi:MAG: dihydrodipicolinate synthase family protein [Tagaea sp.]|nr:dihydrodipicolinate synthase family protein [Tagaea sp.]